jgi:putative peptidoglycan lipid II flippase
VGLAFTIVFGWRFGVTRAADAYYLALVLPTFVTSLAAGAVKLVFVPLFVEERVRNPDGVNRLVGTVHLTFLLASLVAMGATVVLQPLPVADPETSALVKRLTYVLVALIPLGMSFALLNGIYNAYQKFALAEAALGLRALVAVGALLLLGATWGIYSAALGQVVGYGIALLLVAGVVNRTLGVELRPRWLPSAGASRMLRLSALPLASYCLLQLNPVVARAILAMLPTGSVSIMSYAERLAAIPSVMLGTGFTTVLLSHWSVLSVEGDRAELAASLNEAIRTLVVLLVPAVTGLLLLRDPLTMLAFGRGAFDQSALAATSSVFAILVLQTIPLFLHMTIVRILLAERALLAMFWLSLGSGVLNLALMALLGVWMGYGARGVAAGMLLNTSIVMLVTATLVHKRHIVIELGSVFRSTSQVLVASAVMGAVILFLKGRFTFQTTPVALLSTAVLCVAGAIVYFAALRLVGHPHSRWILDRLRDRIRPAQA